MNIYSFLEENAREFQNKICLRYKGEDMTFSELNRITSSFGNALRKKGISRGDRIVIMLPNCPEFVISYMGIVGIGAVAVPVNPSFTARELWHILSDSGSRGIILEKRRLPVLEKLTGKVSLDIVITTGTEGNFKDYTNGPSMNAPEDMDADDTAVIVYSAGLTGHPMGAMLTHRNLDHNSDLLRLCFEADHTDTTLTLIPCFHTFSVSANMLPMIRYGGTIYLMNKLDFKELRYAITEGGVSCISGVPTLFYALTHHPELQDVDYRSMRGLISGGSALPIEVYKEFKNRFNADIHQGYGLTEASPVCTVNDIHVKLKPESIGPTVPGVEARVVDDEGKVLTSNQVGELEFKGPNVMKGYFNRPKETSEVMHDGWLKSGDLGYMDEEGYLYITGYKKQMIITSGFNVYNKEVEDVLNSYPGVRDSAITGEPDLIRGAIVKAFIVKDDPGISENDIKRFARERLAPYKSPRKIVFVKSIPRDNMGKIILDEIKEPDQP